MKGKTQIVLNVKQNVLSQEVTQTCVVITQHFLVYYKIIHIL